MFEWVLSDHLSSQTSWERCNIKAIEKLLLLLLLFYIEGWIVFLQRQRLEVKSDENKNDTIWNFQQK